MNSLQIETSTPFNTISLQIQYPDLPNLTYNFKLTLKLSEQNSKGQLTLIIEKSIYIPERQITLKELKGNQMYKVEIKCSTNGQEFAKNVFAYVPDAPNNQESDQEWLQRGQINRQEEGEIQRRNREERRKRRSSKEKAKEIEKNAFSHSQDLMKMVGKSVGINNEKTLNRYILAGRKCKNTSEFVNLRKQFQQGNPKQAIDKQKMLLKGKMVLQDVYHQREGLTFFKNDWFMGPFYSYDHNERQMAKQ